MKLFRNWQNEFVKTWPVAAAALGGLLLLIATSVLNTSRKAEEIFIELDQLNTHHRDVEVKLQQLREDVQLSGIYIRDYLLDTDPLEAPGYRRRLTELRQSHSATVKDLRAILPRDAAVRLDTLQAKLDEYWESREPLFDWTIAEKMVRGARFLRKEVLPRREAVLAITRDIEKLNDANRAAQRAEVARRETTFRADLQRGLWHSLLLGLVVAFVAVLRLRALESRSVEQRLRAQEAEGEMRLLSQQLVAAQELERKKLTRELHDHVGQMLTALRMEIGRASRAVGTSTVAITQPLDEAKRLLDTILRSVRDLVMGLRPSMLDDFGLQPALEWHVREFRRHFNMRVEMNLQGDLNALPDVYRTCVYRIVQEAMTNCARHSRAAGIRIGVRYESATLDLTVSDDGVGIETGRARGMGLLGIEERVRELHGTFSIRRQSEGTELRVTLPVTQIEEAGLARAAG